MKRQIVKDRFELGWNESDMLDMLKEHHIDTTLNEYELVALGYERYSAGKPYTLAFECHGDYLAYFAMGLHEEPNFDAIDDMYTQYDFEDMLDEFPDVDAIKAHAESFWWGDGDDYIYSLTNTTTGKVLYES